MQVTELTGKTVLITGATGGIGKALLQALSLRGPAVTLVCGSNFQCLERIKTEFPSLNLDPICCDLSTEEGVNCLCAEAQKRLGNQAKLDVVIFAAASLGVRPGDKRPSWNQTLECLALNAIGPDLCLEKMLSENMLDKGSCVVAIGSIAGHKSYRGMENLSAYSMSKAALSRAVRNWAVDHPEMTIFEIAPGAVQTPMLDECRPAGMSQDQWRNELMSDIPIQEIADPGGLAETVLRLIESPALRSFHGSTVHLDGGESIA